MKAILKRNKIVLIAIITVVIIGLFVFIRLFIYDSYRMPDTVPPEISETLNQGVLTLDIPDNALPPGVTRGQIVAEPILASELPAIVQGLGLSYAFRLEPDGLRFASPVAFSMELPNYKGEVPLVYHVSTNGTLEVIEDTKIIVNEEGVAVLSGNLNHFSILGVLMRLDVETKAEKEGLGKRIVEKIKGWFFGPEGGGLEPKTSSLERLLNEYTKKPGATCSQTVFSRASIPERVAQRAFTECQNAIAQKFGQCAHKEGWQAIAAVSITDFSTKPEQQESLEVICSGGCPGEGAGDTYPLKIDTEFIDIQKDEKGGEKKVSYEVVCSAECYSWECGNEPVPKPAIPKPTPTPKSTPVPTSTPTPLALALSYVHTAPGEYSEVFLNLQQAPPNTPVTVTLTGPGVTSPSTQTGTIGANGRLRLTWRINQFGTYRAAGNVGSGTFSDSITVQ